MYKIIFILLIITSQIIAQDKNSSNQIISGSDSSGVESFKLPEAGFKYSIPQNSFYSDRVKFNLDVMNYSYYNSYQFYSSKLETKSLSNDFKRYNKNLQSAMKLIPGFQRKKDLGVLGEILGYTNAAATLGLLIYHLSKHKDKY
ncbi:MAG: hypothetical protein HND52_15800 [Ignavibacteriae bacterium]|nr:hypothetical protein [Ignavibacteriota bacterium]NOG99419.1 hypothetical protein [Ignavibacteriota bacterium]